MDDLCDLALTSIRLLVKRVIPSSSRHQRDLFTRVSCEPLSCRFANETKRDVAVSTWLRPASGFCFAAAAGSGLLSQVSVASFTKRKWINTIIQFLIPLFSVFCNIPHISVGKHGRHIAFVLQQTDPAGGG